ncbi:MAG: MauE/DoxX family redox-associated membrane protein [Thermomicrobiales bacterium]
MERARISVFPILAPLLRVAVGLTLVVAGAGKLLDATAAQASTETTLHISGTFAAVLTVAVSVLEILLGVHLIVGLNLRWSALASVALLGFFLLFVIYLWATGYTGGCGCFGVFGGGSPGPAETARDAILFVAAIVAWLGRDYGPSLDQMMHARA